MEIINETKCFTISSKAELKDSFWGRFRGLMLSKRKDIVLAGKKEAILDSTIHMMFMLYPLDVLWVKEDMTVADVKRNIKAVHPLKPSTWFMHKPVSPAKYVVEITVGDLKDTEIGDKITFK